MIRNDVELQATVERINQFWRRVENIRRVETDPITYRLAFEPLRYDVPVVAHDDREGTATNPSRRGEHYFEAFSLLRDALSPAVQAILHEVAGSRAADGSQPVEVAHVGARLAGVVAGETGILLEKLSEEQGQSDRAAVGIAPTVRALARAQVEVLLIHDDPDVDETAWFGPEAVHVATEAADLEAMGVDGPQSARLADVLIRAALGTGAGVRVLPHAEGLRGGVGAILRWR